MNRPAQDVYAFNLLPRGRGYPLRNPSPKNKSDPEGFRVGDVGYVDQNGRFNPVLNIGSLPEELLGQDKCQNFPLGDQPVGEPAFGNGDVLMGGVERMNVQGPRDVYEFTTNKPEGAILILPEGASRFELEDKRKLDDIRQHAEQYALKWCRFVQQDSLYLITAACKTKSWTLGSFHDESPSKEIIVKRDDEGLYKWTYQVTVDHPVPPVDNFFINQTVLIKGFKITVRWDWLPMVQRAESIEWWFTSLISSLWTIVSRRLTRIKVTPVSLNFSQPRHPLDIINSVLLDKNPGIGIAITHDNDWIQMLERGLLPEYLMQEDKLREFVLSEQKWDLNANHDVVYLRSDTMDNADERQRARDPSSHSRSNDSRPAIINVRLEGSDIDHIYAGVCVVVEFGSATRRTNNKPHADIVEWDDEILLPPDGTVNITVCGVFQLGSSLGTREILGRQTIDPKDLSGNTRVIRFSVGKPESSSSLLITLGRHFSYIEILSGDEDISDFVKMTKSGLDALYSYHDNSEEAQLERALECFQYALDQCLIPTHQATALFNLATSQFIRCQTHGTYSKLSEPLELYEKALKLRDVGHPDRSATLLLLAQTLLSHYGQERDDSIPGRIRRLLDEIGVDNSRNHLTKEVIMRTCTFYRAVHFESPIEVDDLIRDFDRGAYVPPYGYFDKPRMLHKLGVALWERFQRDENIAYLDKSIQFNQEALRLIPDPSGHDDQKSIIDCLGKSFLKQIEMRGDLQDVDMSVDLVELGESVVTALGDMTMEDIGVSLEEVRKEVALMSAADAALQYMEYEVPSPRIPMVQNLVDEWGQADSIPMRCKRQLGTLLSFLEGQGKAKMYELLGENKWHFREYKTRETMRVLQNCIPYFEDSFATRLGI